MQLLELHLADPLNLNLPRPVDQVPQAPDLEAKGPQVIPIINIMLIYLLLPTLLTLSLCSNKAILISSSIGFYNYRQGANILKIYNHLKQRGYKDSDIILMLPENGKCILKNGKLGSVSFYDGFNTDLCKDTLVDYSQSDMKLRDVYNTLTFKYHPYALNAKRMDSGKGTNLLVYFSGHGGDDYFKLLEREAILKEHLKSLTDYLARNQLYSKILFISDSCSASTIFEDIVAKNIVYLASSSREQKSLSYGYDIALNAAKSDEFTYYTDMFLNDEKNSGATIKELYDYLDFAKLKVNSKMYSTVPKGTNKLRLTEFFNKKATPSF